MIKYVAALLLYFATSAIAGNMYYIATNGNDTTGDGSSETPWATLSHAFGEISGGDDLTLKNGTYTGADNQFRYNNAPPTGSAEDYTTIQAETSGSVILNGENTQTMFDFYGTTGNDYVEIIGLQFVNQSSSYDHGLTGASNADRSATYWKIKQCGFQGGFSVGYTSYVLVEDCYAVGKGRYNFIAFNSDHVIFRRCVARLDQGNGGGMPISNFCQYNSQQLEFQNCIAIDSDSQYYTNYNYAFGGFYLRYNDGSNGASTDTFLRGNIVLNVHHNTNLADGSLTLSGGMTGTTLIENTIIWDSTIPYVLANGPISSAYTFNHCLQGNAIYSHAYNNYGIGNAETYASNYGDIGNSIFYNLQNTGAGNLTAVHEVKSSNFNCFYGNDSDKSTIGSSTGDITEVDPTDNSLKYLVRIEDESDLDGAASDSGDIGPTILKKIGIDGTLYGESGYTTTTANDLWPWPNEDEIKDFFINYGSSSNPSPSRGFCALSTSITEYIWEYLGNEIPSDIYGEESNPQSGVGLSGCGLQ